MCEASNFEEPGAVVPHAGICTGAAGQLAVLPWCGAWMWDQAPEAWRSRLARRPLQAEAARSSGLGAMPDGGKTRGPVLRLQSQKVEATTSLTQGVMRSKFNILSGPRSRFPV